MSKSCWRLGGLNASMRSDEQFAIVLRIRWESHDRHSSLAHWLIDEYSELLAFESVTAAHDFWTKLKAERDCRLESNPSDTELSTFWGKYDLVFDAARAMIDIKAISSSEIASKIEVAMEIIDLGGCPFRKLNPSILMVQAQFTTCNNSYDAFGRRYSLCGCSTLWRVSRWPLRPSRAHE